MARKKGFFKEYGKYLWAYAAIGIVGYGVYYYLKNNPQVKSYTGLTR